MPRHGRQQITVRKGKMKKTGALLCFVVAMFAFCQAQDPGSSVVLRPKPAKETVLAIPDFQGGAGAAEQVKTLDAVIWSDLDYAGYFRLVPKSFYPARPVAGKGDIAFPEWQQATAGVDFIVAGNARLEAGVLVVECRVFDAKTEEQIFGKQYKSQPSYARSIGHLIADKIVALLTAGASRGIASTRIVCERKTKAGKEIVVMDYDGYGQEALTADGTLNLTPTWHPDGDRVCFTTYKGGNPQLCFLSSSTRREAIFPIAGGMLTTPAISFGGAEIAFAGRLDNDSDTDIYVSSLDGGNPRNLTHNQGIDVCPSWSPTGKQLVFVSSRTGSPQLYMCDAFGAGVEHVPTEGGYATSPEWSPDGRYIAFSWKPGRGSNFDIYVMEVGSRKLFQVTHGAGNNDNPSWAPDSRHIVFQSDRNGGQDIFTMFLDGENVRQITRGGGCSNPAWSGYPAKQ